MKKLGVYQLKNTITGKVYFGSSKDLKSRRRKHLSMLKLNKHESANIRKDCEKYGPEVFEFEILAYVPEDELLEYEQVLLDLDVEKYNRCLIAGSSQGVKYSEESRRKMSERRKGKAVPKRLKPLIAYRDDGASNIEFRFAGRKQAVKALGLGRTNIQSVLNGRQKTTGGWKFKEA